MADRRTQSRSRTPLWVKLMGVAAVALAVLFAILHLTGVVGMGSHH